MQIDNEDLTFSLETVIERYPTIVFYKKQLHSGRCRLTTRTSPSLWRR